MADRPDNAPKKPSSGTDPEGKKHSPHPPSQAPARGPMGLGLVLLLVVVVVLLLSSAGQSGHKIETRAEFQRLYESQQLEPGSIEVRSDRVVAIRLADDVETTKPHPVYLKMSPELKESYFDWLSEITSGKVKDKGGPPIWQQILFSPLSLTLVFVVLIFWMLSRAARSAGGAGGGMLGGFARSKHRVLAKDSTGVTFKDVAGVDEAKDEVSELVEFLRHPKKFARLGARIPRGVLLEGPPGTGKTLLAKAIAGEADVPFFSISGSDFVEMFVGVGASRVRDLFKQAKENSPCIIFLDEIDAVGRKRSGGASTGGHDEREQTLNAILVEMDGFESSDQVIVIAATNRVDVLDKALTRPGRFDRAVMVPLPDLRGRLEILKVHADKVHMDHRVDLERIARGTPMFSGAELAAVVNESAIIATLAGKETVTHGDLEEARDKVKFGRAKKSRSIEEDERIATAYHEAGHAVLQSVLPDSDPLHKVTIIPRGQFGGASMSLPEKDRYGYGQKWLRSAMAIACGGRIAEERKTGDVSSGASADIDQVTGIARTMVLDWGMSDRLGFVRYSADESQDSIVLQKGYAEQTAETIDAEVRRFADEAYQLATRTIDAHWEQVSSVAEALLVHETLTANEVTRLLRGETLQKPTVIALLAAEAAKLDADDSDADDSDADDSDADDSDAGDSDAGDSDAGSAQETKAPEPE